MEQTQLKTNNNKQPLLQQQQNKQNKVSKRAVKSLQSYRKKLLAQVVTIFIICLMVILERVFYQMIAQKQQDTLSDLQLSIGLTVKNNNTVQADGITNSFLKFYGSLSQFPVQFLLLTHFLVTLYVSFDALFTAKLTYVSLCVVYLVSVLQMFYAGARPFWTSQNIMSSHCLQSYNHPSIGLILLTFVPLYAYYCYTKKHAHSQSESIPKNHILYAVLSGLIIILSQILNYFVGGMYIINIVMSLVISTLLLMVGVAGHSVIDSAVRKSTILKTDAKKYVFYWLLFICLLGTFVLVVFSDWVDNFMSCTKYQNYAPVSYRYDQIIGPWFNFTQTSTLFGWIGAVFGISSAFRNIPNIEWAAGNTKNRIIRGVIANLFIIPSWLFVLLAQSTGPWVKDIGLNAFIVDSIHFFVLYLWLFGYLPILVMHRVLKITNRDDQDFYVIVEKSEIM